MVKHVPLLHLSSPLKAMPPRRPGWNEDHRMTFTRWLDALILKNHLLTYFVSRNDAFFLIIKSLARWEVQGSHHPHQD